MCGFLFTRHRFVESEEWSFEIDTTDRSTIGYFILKHLTLNYDDGICINRRDYIVHRFFFGELIDGLSMSMRSR